MKKRLQWSIKDFNLLIKQCTLLFKEVYKKYPGVVKIKKWNSMTLSKCEVCEVENQEQEASGLLSNLGIKTPPSEILILGYILI